MEMKVESGDRRRGTDHAGGSSVSAIYTQSKPWWESYGNNNDLPTGIREMSLRSVSENTNVVTVGGVYNYRVSSVENNEVIVNKEIPSGIPLQHGKCLS